MRKASVVILTIVIVLVFEAIGLLALIYSGAYNISTYNHDNGVINWALDKGMTRSVARHAKAVKTPALPDSTRVQQGFTYYHRLCIPCHGAPGVAAGGISKGLWPTAPDLAKTVPQWTPAELFWITRNGVKFTAMPARGPTHDEAQLWALVAFLKKLPQLSPDEYRDLQRKAGAD